MQEDKDFEDLNHQVEMNKWADVIRWIVYGRDKVLELMNSFDSEQLHNTVVDYL